MEYEPVAMTRIFSWLLFGGVLIVLFVFARRRFRQVVLLVVLSVVLGDVWRLFTLSGGDRRDLLAEGYVVLGLAALYGVVWLITRHASRKRPDTSRSDGGKLKG